MRELRSEVVADRVPLLGDLEPVDEVKVTAMAASMPQKDDDRGIPRS